MRRLVATLAVLALVVGAGCTGLFGDDVTDEDLDREPPQAYEWDTRSNATYTVLGDRYQAVLNVSAFESGPNETAVSLYAEDLARQVPLSIEALRYRYPNGTVVNGSALAVERRDDGRVVAVPESEGKLAYTADAGIKQFGVPRYVAGSHEVVLPPGMRVEDFLLGDASPGNYESSVDDRDRLRLRWADPEDGVYVRYYLGRDQTIFRGLAVVLGLVALVGAAYYVRKIRALERRREELGLDVDTDADDEFDDGPPPGMR
jgi:hypothetical protein